MNTTGLEKKWFLYSLIVCVLHAFSIWLYYGSRQTVQGRYLYPIIIPIIILVYSGLQYFQEWFRLKRDYILIAYIIFQVVLVVFAITRIISVFYLEIASPHPGL
jgi:ABC-type spermidine/putrescine transport system permease subunit II